jgi:hypothetical protein
MLAPILLLCGSLLYAEGVGVNITANAIARKLGVPDSSQAASLTYVLDEHIGHALWHAGVVLITCALVAAAWRHVSPTESRTSIVALAGLLYGFTWFTDGVEGQTVLLMFPSAVALTLLILGGYGSRTPLSGNPVLLCMVIATATAAALFGIWWIWQGAFVQFSELGWI